MEEVTLTLSSLTWDHGTQMGLFDGPRRDRERRIAETERRRRDRLGGVHVLYRVEEVAPWHPAPEMWALQVSVDSSAREAVRPLHSPEPVEVREGAEREPVSVLYRKRWRHVARIDDRWMFDLWWLPRPVTRTYYRVDPGDGVPVTVFPRRVEWTLVPAERLTASEDERRSRWTFIPTGGSDDHTPDLAVEDLTRSCVR